MSLAGTWLTCVCVPAQIALLIINSASLPRTTGPTRPAPANHTRPRPSPAPELPAERSGRMPGGSAAPSSLGDMGGDTMGVVSWGSVYIEVLVSGSHVIWGRRGWWRVKEANTGARGLARTAKRVSMCAVAKCEARCCSAGQAHVRLQGGTQSTPRDLHPPLPPAPARTAPAWPAGCRRRRPCQTRPACPRPSSPGCNSGQSAAGVGWGWEGQAQASMA